jgi:MFS family permease
MPAWAMVGDVYPFFHVWQVISMVQSSGTASTPRPAARGSLAIIFLTVFIDLLGFAMVIPLLPLYAEQFQEDQSGWRTGLLMAIFSLMQFLFAPLWGRLSDRIGRRPVLLVGLAGAALFYAAFGVATVFRSYAGLLLSRAAAGIACATIPVAQAYIADTTSLEHRAKGMAIIGAAFGVGFCFGPLIGAAALVLSSDVGTSPWPGYVAAGLSALSFFLALIWLPESLQPGSRSAGSHVFAPATLAQTLAIPSVGELLLTSFIGVLSFGGFETTLALLLKGEKHGFHLSHERVLLFFSFVGLVLSLAQGGLVRRLSGRVSEGPLATAGLIVSLLGFLLMIAAAHLLRFDLLLLATTVEVVGFAFITPSLQALLSRRSDPTRQGIVAGVSQSVSALARIAGPFFGIMLLKRNVLLPYAASAALTLLALVMLRWALRRGHDYGSAHAGENEPSGIDGIG